MAAKVVDAGNKNGYVELSLKEARTAAIWTEAEQAIAEKKVFDLPIKEANKGGLIVEWQGIVGFCRLHNSKRNIILAYPTATKTESSKN